MNSHVGRHIVMAYIVMAHIVRMCIAMWAGMRMNMDAHIDMFLAVCSVARNGSLICLTLTVAQNILLFR